MKCGIKKRTIGNKTRRTGFLLFCILPSLLLYLFLMVYPSLKVFFNSVFSWSGLSVSKEFTGFKNYITLFQDKLFWLSFRNTVILMIMVTIITMALSMFLAFALTQSKLKEKGFYRTLFFFPNVLSVVVIGVLFQNIYAPGTGILNSGLEALGLSSLTRAWLGDPNTVLWAIGIAMVWQAFGYYMVMYLAGMDSISPELYEVADLEGASKFYQFFKITLPLMWEVVRVTLVFFIITNINMSFLFVNVMTNGAPNGGSEVLLSYMYRQAFTNANFGYAMAVAVAVFIFSFVLALITNKLTERKE